MSAERRDGSGRGEEELATKGNKGGEKEGVGGVVKN